MNSERGSLRSPLSPISPNNFKSQWSDGKLQQLSQPNTNNGAFVNKPNLRRVNTFNSTTKINITGDPENPPRSTTGSLIPRLNTATQLPPVSVCHSNQLPTKLQRPKNNNNNSSSSRIPKAFPPLQLVITSAATADSPVQEDVIKPRNLAASLLSPPSLLQQEQEEESAAPKEYTQSYTNPGYDTELGTNDNDNDGESQHHPTAMPHTTTPNHSLSVDAWFRSSTNPLGLMPADATHRAPAVYAAATTASISINNISSSSNNAPPPTPEMYAILAQLAAKSPRHIPEGVRELVNSYLRTGPQELSPEPSFDDINVGQLYYNNNNNRWNRGPNIAAPHQTAAAVMQPGLMAFMGPGGQGLMATVESYLRTGPQHLTPEPGGGGGDGEEGDGSGSGLVDVLSPMLVHYDAGAIEKAADVHKKHQDGGMMIEHIGSSSICSNSTSPLPQHQAEEEERVVVVCPSVAAAIVVEDDVTVGSHIVADNTKNNNSSSDGGEEQHSGVSMAEWLEQGTAWVSSSVSQQKQQQQAKSASSFSFGLGAGRDLKEEKKEEMMMAGVQEGEEEVTSRPAAIAPQIQGEGVVIVEEETGEKNQVVVDGNNAANPFSAMLHHLQQNLDDVASPVLLHKPAFIFSPAAPLEGSPESPVECTPLDLMSDGTVSTGNTAAAVEEEGSISLAAGLAATLHPEASPASLFSSGGMEATTPQLGCGTVSKWIARRGLVDALDIPARNELRQLWNAAGDLGRVKHQADVLEDERDQLRAELQLLAEQLVATCTANIEKNNFINNGGEYAALISQEPTWSAEAEAIRLQTVADAKALAQQFKAMVVMYDKERSALVEELEAADVLLAQATHGQQDVAGQLEELQQQLMRAEEHIAVLEAERNSNSNNGDGGDDDYKAIIDGGEMMAASPMTRLAASLQNVHQILVNLDDSMYPAGNHNQDGGGALSSTTPSRRLLAISQNQLDILDRLLQSKTHALEQENHALRLAVEEARSVLAGGDLLAPLSPMLMMSPYGTNSIAGGGGGVSPLLTRYAHLLMSPIPTSTAVGRIAMMQSPVATAAVGEIDDGVHIIGNRNEANHEEEEAQEIEEEVQPQDVAASTGTTTLTTNNDDDTMTPYKCMECSPFSQQMNLPPGEEASRVTIDYFDILANAATPPPPFSPPNNANAYIVGENTEERRRVVAFAGLFAGTAITPSTSIQNGGGGGGVPTTTPMPTPESTYNSQTCSPMVNVTGHLGLTITNVPEGEVPRVKEMVAYWESLANYGAGEGEDVVVDDGDDAEDTAAVAIDNSNNNNNNDTLDPSAGVEQEDSIGSVGMTPSCGSGFEEWPASVEDGRGDSIAAWHIASLQKSTATSGNDNDVQRKRVSSPVAWPLASLQKSTYCGSDDTGTVGTLDQEDGSGGEVGVVVEEGEGEELDYQGDNEATAAAPLPLSSSVLLLPQGIQKTPRSSSSSSTKDLLLERGGDAVVVVVPNNTPIGGVPADHHDNGIVEMAMQAAAMMGEEKDEQEGSLAMAMAMTTPMSVAAVDEDADINAVRSASITPVPLSAIRKATASKAAEIVKERLLRIRTELMAAQTRLTSVDNGLCAAAAAAHHHYCYNADTGTPRSVYSTMSSGGRSSSSDMKVAAPTCTPSTVAGYFGTLKSALAGTPTGETLVAAAAALMRGGNNRKDDANNEEEEEEEEDIDDNSNNNNVETPPPPPNTVTAARPSVRFAESVRVGHSEFAPLKYPQGEENETAATPSRRHSQQAPVSGNNNNNNNINNSSSSLLARRPSTPHSSAMGSNEAFSTRGDEEEEEAMTDDDGYVARRMIEQQSVNKPSKTPAAVAVVASPTRRLNMYSSSDDDDDAENMGAVVGSTKSIKYHLRNIANDENANTNSATLFDASRMGTVRMMMKSNGQHEEESSPASVKLVRNDPHSRLENSIHNSSGGGSKRHLTGLATPLGRSMLLVDSPGGSGGGMMSSSSSLSSTFTPPEPAALKLAYRAGGGGGGGASRFRKMAGANNGGRRVPSESEEKEFRRRAAALKIHVSPYFGKRRGGEN